MPHAVVKLKKGNFWCLVCKASLEERKIELDFEDDLEVELKLE